MGKHGLKTLAVVLIVLIAAQGCGTTRPTNHEAQTLQERSQAHYDRGAAAADSLYVSATPIFAGLGIIALAPVLASMSQTGGGPNPSLPALGVTGILVALANNKDDRESTPLPDGLADGLSGVQLSSFEEGYRDRVHDIQRGRFGVGIMIGFAVNIILLGSAIKSIDGPLGGV